MTAQGTPGQYGTSSLGSTLDAFDFMIRQRLGEVRTSVPVKIIAVHGGGVAAAPTVDVQPMVKQADGIGTSSSHGIIYGIPVARNQGGLNAIINDPQVNDVGHLVVSDRDISSVKNNAGGESNPSSRRRHSMMDGVYHAAMLNAGAPNQYVQFQTNGIRIVDNSGNSIVMGTGGISISSGSGPTSMTAGGTGFSLTGGGNLA